MWTTNPVPSFDGQPLADGVYAQTARTLYCANKYDPPPTLQMSGTLVEIEGCLLRIIAPGQGEDGTIFAVEKFSYVGPGKLELTIECPAHVSIPNAPFAFDGTTLPIPNSTQATGPDGEPYNCTYVDTWTKR